MFYRFFQWWARRRTARTRYRIDRRHYHGRFRAGFLSHLQNAHFWESDRDPAMRRQRFRRRLFWVFAAVLLVFLGWIAWESARAFAIF